MERDPSPPADVVARLKARTGGAEPLIYRQAEERCFDSFDQYLDWAQHQSSGAVTSSSVSSVTPATSQATYSDMVTWSKPNYSPNGLVKAW